MHLLLVTFDPPTSVGGIEGRVKGIIGGLGSSDKIVIEALYQLGGFGESTFTGVPYFTCPSGLRQLPRVLGVTESLLRRRSIDTVFLLSGGATAFGIALLVRCRLAGCPNAILFYGKDILEAKSKPQGRFFLAASQFLAGRVLANSGFTASLLSAWVRPKLHVLYPSIDPAFGEKVAGEQSTGERKILFVGRLVERKGTGELIQAVNELRRSRPGIKLDIVGDGPDRPRLERIVSKLDLAGSVTFFGSLSGLPLLERYSHCDVFALPSKASRVDVEGFGTVFLEAGWFAKPSVGTNSGGIPEAVVDGKTGLLVEEGSVSQLVNALAKLLDDESLRMQMGQNARKRVMDSFTWSTSSSRLREFLQGK